MVEMENYLVEFYDHQIEVEVPKGTNRVAAFDLFCAAAAKHLGFKNRHFVVSKCDREYEGCGGLFQAYLMPDDRSGYVIAEGWFEAWKK